MTAVKSRLLLVTAASCALAVGLGSTAQATASPATPAAAAAAPAAGGGWSSAPTPAPTNRSGEPRASAEPSAPAFTLDAGTLLASVAGAPLENTAAAARALPVVVIPGADGLLHRFTLVESPVMEPGLGAKVAFRSWAATSVDEPGTTARLDYSPAIGFHATVRSPSGSWDVDPAYSGDTTTYLAHRGELSASTAVKNVEDQAERAAGAAVTPAAVPVAGALVTQRVYRMALASNPAYADIVGAANVDAVKAAVVNRVDEVYNDELAIKFVLVTNNDLLDFNTQAQYTGANGPCGVAACYTPVAADPASGLAADDLSACGPVIDQNVAVFDTIIGNENFDIGHILANGNTGGVAAGFAGQDVNKAKGCSGTGTGTGDGLAVEFFGHELGHQFGASHTFSSASCGGFSQPNATEPASGASIMSYAGTCAGDDNIQQFSDPYFVQTSIDQIQAYVNSTIDPAENGGKPVENGGSTTVVTTNHHPVVTVPGTAVIPVRTPFTLTGSVTDADTGQVPVNEWEQNDAGTIRPLADNAKTDGPLFRMFSRAATPTDYDTTLNAAGESEATAAGSSRTFPDLAQVAAGNTNAAAGTCPASAPLTQDEKECFAEFLPTTARALHFDLVARDRYTSGGGVTSAQTVVTVAGTTPFAVTNTAASVAAGSSYPVTWNVAGTTAAPFGVANVKISYSTDGGLTFPTVLAASTPNDGSQAVTVPAGTTTTGRFKVEAIGQPFFDLSHANLTVTAGPVTTPPRADLAVSVSVPAQVVPGAALTATVTVVNNGPAAASQVSTALLVLPGLTVTDAGGATRVGTQVLVFSAGSLASGATATYTVALTAPQARQVFLLPALTRSATPDPRLLNNLGAAITRVA